MTSPTDHPVSLTGMVEDAWRTGQRLDFSVVTCTCELGGLLNTSCPTHGRPEDPIYVDAVHQDVDAVTAAQLIGMLLELEPNTRVWFEDCFGVVTPVGPRLTRPAPDAADLGWAQLGDGRLP